jgi:cytochrome P450
VLAEPRRADHDFLEGSPGMQLQVPDHVPRHLVFDFDIYTAKELEHEPHRTMVELLRSRQVPPIFFTPRNGGHWIVAGAVEGLEMLRDIERFSSEPQYNANSRKPWTLPNQADPPEHTEYRRIINPAFVPRAVAVMEDGLRALSVQMVEELVPRGGCSFVEDVAKKFPVNVFLRMAGAPQGDREMLVDLTEQVVRHPDRAAREAASHAMGAYVMKAYEARRGREGEDLLSMVLQGRFQGRGLNDEELLGMGLLLFLGGLDTVASTLGFVMLFLARHPQQYRQLVDDPALIPGAVEELIRVHSVASVQRGVREDTEYLGISMRRNDKMFFMTQLYGLDERKIDDPLRVDFTRPVSPHLGFGAGPHRCIGSHLARTEVRIFLEEWTRRIPRMSLAGDGAVRTRGGHVWSPVEVPLRW